jgi:hypothetical protein
VVVDLANLHVEPVVAFSKTPPVEIILDPLISEVADIESTLTTLLKVLLVPVHMLVADKRPLDELALASTNAHDAASVVFVPTAFVGTIIALLKVLLGPDHVLVPVSNPDVPELALTKAVVATLVELSVFICVEAVIVAPVKLCVPVHTAPAFKFVIAVDTKFVVATLFDILDAACVNAFNVAPV